MTFNEKIVVFYVLLALLLFMLRAFPGSIASRFAFTWFGPVPRPGELRSSYMWRWSKYAAGWYIQLGVVVAAGIYSVEVFPHLEQSLLFQAVFFFGLPLLCGTAFLGVLLALGAAAKARWFGPNPSWEYTPQNGQQT